MIINNMEDIVAQNCINYNPKYIVSLLSALSSSESCYNCKNFIHGKCTQGVFDEIKDILTRN